jgi:pilus assembly protein Flp/PilA
MSERNNRHFQLNRLEIYPRYFAARSKRFVNHWGPLKQNSADKEPLMKNLVARFAIDDSAATAVEYGLVAAGISVAIIAVVQGLGNNLKTAFSSLSGALK